MSPCCPLCRSENTPRFFELDDMPVSIGIQWPTVTAARACARADIHLALCLRCGFIWNEAFDPARLEYSQAYDNSLDFSPVFQNYARGLARRLVENYDIRGKDVVEIGCGKGHFLSLLCEEGENRGIGFDPSYEGARARSAAGDRITYVQDFYGEAYTRHGGDLVCCRHVFEHIADPIAFLSMVRRTLGNRRSTVVYFEVPNVRFILDRLSAWDVIYEHCNYFGLESAAYAFARCGFEIIRLDEAYDGQFLAIEARPGEPDEAADVPTDDTAELADAARHFAAEVRTRAQMWTARLERFRQTGRRVVAWGGGSKAVSFLNMLKIDDAIPYVVDINPYKQGKHLAGTGQQLVSPAFLRRYRPDIVVLMNPIYRTEVEVQLRRLGVAAEVIAV